MLPPDIATFSILPGVASSSGISIALSRLSTRFLTCTDEQEPPEAVTKEGRNSGHEPSVPHRERWGHRNFLNIVQHRASLRRDERLSAGTLHMGNRRSESA